MAIAMHLAGVHPFVKEEELEAIAPQVAMCNQWLYDKTAPGNAFLGWVDWPEAYDKAEFARIQTAAKKIQQDSRVLIVIGIGGSYLGTRAAIEFCKGPFYNSRQPEGMPEVYFVGNNITSSYLQDVLDIVGDRDFSINVISKSGTTTEPAIAFRFFKVHLEKKYGKEGAKSRIYATTDAQKGALKKLADGEGYETFVVPDHIGGRFSVLSAVGLLAIAASGIDIAQMMQGARDAMERYASGDIKQNDALRYAALRNILLRKGKNVEILVNYDPALTMFGEWYKQLFAESEGKDQKGIFPVSANFTTDLHSIGQFIQDGSRNLFETVLWIKQDRAELVLGEVEEDIDGLNYLTGKTVQFCNEKAYQATMLAHVDGGTPNIVVEVDQADAYHFGALVYFFEKACGVSGYLLGVNPFNQPGVEDYKKNMFALLGKPGFEQAKALLEARMQ